MTITGKITAWFFVGGSLGGMTLPLIIGQFFDTAGPRIAPAVMCASVVLAASVFHFRTFSIRQVKEYLKSKGLEVIL